MNYFLTILKKYFVFSGRARRKEFWYFVLFDSLIQLLLIYLATGFYSEFWTSESFLTYVVILVLMIPRLPVYFWIYTLAVMVPRIAVFVRRLHDVNKSGWYLFIVLIPVYGIIRLLILLAGDSQRGEKLHLGGESDSKDDNKKSGYCTKCGNKIDAGSKFCTKCGNKN